MQSVLCASTYRKHYFHVWIVGVGSKPLATAGLWRDANLSNPQSKFIIASTKSLFMSQESWWYQRTHICMRSVSDVAACIAPYSIFHLHPHQPAEGCESVVLVAEFINIFTALMYSTVLIRTLRELLDAMLYLMTYFTSHNLAVSCKRYWSFHEINTYLQTVRWSLLLYQWLI